jgi:hypothetical protein
MNISRWTRALVVTLAFGLAGGSARAAQAPGSSVLGFLIDQQGKPIAGVPITLVNNVDNRKATPVLSEPSGLYTLRGVRPGSYQVQATLPGFKRAVVELDIDPDEPWVVAPFLILWRGQVAPMRELSPSPR